MAKKAEKLVLPALRGHMGDWVYYSALMTMSELSDRVKYAHEVRKRNEQEMSRFIQRALETTSRVTQIANYLKTDERFFNSLVLAMYGGDPGWLDISLKDKSAEARAIVENVKGWGVDSLGFLELTGKEKIFALDGQHRLAGIKAALVDDEELSDDLVSVIFVGHRNTNAGNIRTRRLFTTLNKTAVKVRKRDIIALDEDDVMAIITRKFVETSDWFRPPKISLASSTNVPKPDATALTTIVNLYDTLKILFSKGMGTRLEVLRFNRPSDKQLDTYEKYALEFFECVHASFPEVRDYLDAAPSNVDGSALRSASGGHLLFRPIGLEIIAENYCHLKKSRVLSQSEITSLLSSLPSQLSEAPYRGLVWNPRKESINTKGKGVAKRVVGYMLGSDTDEATLLADYRKALEGVEKPEEMKLPEKVA